MVPSEWMPACKMARVIVHWSAGGHKASSVDREHYHVLIEGDGKLVRGDHSIKANVSTSDADGYAAHTKGCNTGSIGVALCAMMNAKEKPFDPGPYPITAMQIDVLDDVLADLCRTYKIPVTPQTVLSHAEVEKTLGIKQSGKWDVSWPPQTAKQVGDKMRAKVKALLG